MVDWYTTTKFVHVMLVVLVGCMSAVSGVWLEFAAIVYVMIAKPW